MTHADTPDAVRVRRAGAADAQTLASLNREVQALHARLEPALFKPPGPGTLGTEEASAILAGAPHVVFLAEAGGQPVGYAYAEVRRRGETSYAYAYDEVYLHHLSVAAAWHRRGIGRALLTAVAEEGRRLGIARLALDVWTVNASARAFFRALGFSPYNERLARGGRDTGHEPPPA
jgi:GNAT superfamily N-acetyltransferase